MQVLERDVVAIIGPQSSVIAHVLSHIANALHVPLISYAATDPTLSTLQFPYFVRTAPTDSHQMAAIANLLEYYGWKEVIAIFVDDDYGRNGISVLGDQLAKRASKISYKVPLPSNYTTDDITYLLNSSKSLGPRVYVVHINPDPELRLFRLAKKLDMISSNYIWFVTDWLSTTLDSFSAANQVSMGVVEGVIVLRPHLPVNEQTKSFESRWRQEKQNSSEFLEMNVYGKYAYDTVWAVALSINELLEENKNLTFSATQDMQAGEPQHWELKTFDSGEKLLQILLGSNFTGLTGQIQFDDDRNLVNHGFEVLNVVNDRTKRVGYWSNYSGLSILPPEEFIINQVSQSPLDQKLENVTWPGGLDEQPRGWIIANKDHPLRIGVPNRVSFIEFVSEMNYSHKVQGYCIDLFEEATALVPYDVPFKFVPFGDGHENPSYDKLVKSVVDGVFDAAVGDIAIVTNRTRMVDFTQPYASTGLVIVATIDRSKASTWVFLKPFTPQLWGVTAISFVIIAIVIWILEHRVNDDFRGPPQRQLVTMFLFSFSTLFKANQEYTVSTLGRMVMLIWLFLLLVVTSSYTASLTSILTVQQLSSPITGIDSLITGSFPIGYQVGSFAYSYMTDTLNIAPYRLKSLGSPKEYEKALQLGPPDGVSVIVDELPYVELFLSDQTEFGIVGQSFTKSGWGFAFQKDSPLAVDMSTAILKLSENGRLQEIHDRWFCKAGCASPRMKYNDPDKLALRSFWGLYLLCGACTLTALILFMLRTIRQYTRFKRKLMDPSSPAFSVSSNTRFFHIIFSFFDFIDEKEEAIKRIFTQHDSGNQSQVA